MPGSSVSSCHMCHMHSHHPEGLLRTNPLRNSRHRVKSSHQKYVGNRAYSHHNGYASAQEDNYVRRSHSSGGMGRLGEHSHPMVTRSRSNSLSGYPGEVSILPDGMVSSPYGLSHGTSTRSLDLNNTTMPYFVEPRNCSLPRLDTSLHHSHIVPQADILINAPPPRSRVNSRSGTLTRTPAASIAGQDNSHDYYLHLHRQRFKEEKRKHRFNLQTVMLIGCYTILIMIAIVVGVVVCYQNGWLGLGKQEKIQENLEDSAVTGGTFTGHPDISAAVRDRNKLLNQPTNHQNNLRTRLTNTNSNNQAFGSTSDNKFSVNSNAGGISNKQLDSVNFAGFFPSNPIPSSGSARDIFTNVNQPSHSNQGVNLINAGLQNDHRSNQGHTISSQNDHSAFNLDSRGNLRNLNSQKSPTQQIEQGSRHFSSTASRPTMNSPAVTQRNKVRTVGVSNQNGVNILMPQSRETQLLNNEQPQTQHRHIGLQTVKANPNLGSTGVSQNFNTRLPQESRSSLHIVDGVIPVGSLNRPTAPPHADNSRSIISENVDSNVIHANVPRTHAGVHDESHIPVVRNLLNPIDSGRLKDTGSLTTQELLDLLALRRMKDLLNSGGNEKSILEVLRSASPSGDIRLEAIKEERITPTNDVTFRQKNREARRHDINSPSSKVSVNSKHSKPPLPLIIKPAKEGIAQAKSVIPEIEEPANDQFQGLNSNTSFSVISSLINNTVNGAILRLLNSKSNFDNAKGNNTQEPHLANVSPKVSIDNHDLSFLLNSEMRDSHGIELEGKVQTQDKLSSSVDSVGRQKLQSSPAAAATNQRFPLESSDLSFIVGTSGFQRNATSSQNIDQSDAEENLKNLILLQKLVALNNGRQKNSKQLIENPSVFNDLSTPKAQSKISQSQGFSLPISEFIQSSSVSRLGIPVSLENNSEGRLANEEFKQARPSSNLPNINDVIISKPPTQSVPIQKAAGPDPSFAVLVKTDGTSTGQKSPKSLFSSPSRTTASNGGTAQPEPVKELVQVLPGSGNSKDSMILRAWTHMDKSGTLSHGQVHSDGSFSFTNCRPIESCNSS